MSKERNEIAPLAGKHVLLGITGSIAAYKAAIIVRLLQKEGAEVKAIMSESGMRFIGSETLKALTGHRVYSDIFATDEDWQDNHISLADWADCYLIAPATANTIACLACGNAGNLLCSIGLTMPPDKMIIAPAMNTSMWLHPATRDNMEKLRQRGTKVIDAATGELACGSCGAGRLADPPVIVEHVLSLLKPQVDLTGRRIVITAGPTREWLDDVRYVSNPSSGKVGFAFLRAVRACGADANLVLGPVPHIPDDIASDKGLVRVETARDMQVELEHLLPSADVLVMAAAVSDYRPQVKMPGKLKKDAEEMTVRFVRNPDILKGIAIGPVNPVIVGFALEADDHLANAEKKLAGKNMDLLVLNNPESFGSSAAAFTLLRRNGSSVELGRLSKDELAVRVIKEIETILCEGKVNNEGI